MTKEQIKQIENHEFVFSENGFLLEKNYVTLEKAKIIGEITKILEWQVDN